MSYVLVITQLPLLKAGNQILAQTMLGWLSAGYEVALLTSAPLDFSNAADPRGIFGKFQNKVEITHFVPPVRRIRSRLQVGAPAASKTRSVVASPQTRRFPAIEEVTPFERSSLLYDIASFGSWVSFQWGANRAARALLLRRGRPSLIYGYEIFGAPVARRLALQTGVPHVTKFQGTVLPSTSSPNLLTKARKSLHYLGLSTPAPLIFMENDGTCGDVVLRQLGHPADNIRFWVDGVRKDLYDPATDRLQLAGIAPVKPNDLVLVTVSRLKPWKRLDRALWLMAALAERPNIKLLIVGEGPEEANLRSLALQLGLDGRVAFVGGLPHSQVRVVLNNCDLFLSLYDHSNLCNPVLEALECGCCIVSIDDGSTRNVLSDQVNARLVRTGKLRTELPLAVGQLLDDPAMRVRLKGAAREYAVRNLRSWSDRMALEVHEAAKLIEETGE